MPRSPSGGSSSARHERNNAGPTCGRHTKKRAARRDAVIAASSAGNRVTQPLPSRYVQPRRRIAMTNKILEQVEQAYLKKDIPQFTVGDTVDVHTRIVEGDKERIQVFSGTVIMRKGKGMNETFTVRRIVNNEGVERIFPTHSPYISKVVVKRGGDTRRAKLFYLRDRVGKAVKLTEKKPTGGAGGAAGADGKKTAKPAPTKTGAESRELAGAAS